MSEVLSIRLTSQPNTAIAWVVWSSSQQAVIASGELPHLSDLSQLVNYAKQRSVMVLLSAREVILRQVSIPAGAQRRLASLLPYLLEDELAQEVEQLHFSVLATGHGQAQVAGVDRQWLTGILAQFSALGIEVKRVLPDVLALPHHEQLSALSIGNEWLVRKGFMGLSLAEHQLELLTQSEWVKQDNEVMALNAYSPLPTQIQQTQPHWQAMPYELPMQLLTEQALSHSVNLLTGEFQPKSSWSKPWRIWRKALVAALVCLAVSLAGQAMQWWQETQQAQAYREQSETLFRQVFPDKQRIPTVSYLKRQFTDEIVRLQKGKQQESVLIWLSDVAPTLKTVPNVHLKSLRFDGQRGELRLEIVGPDFQRFEQIRLALAAHFQVEQGPLNKVGEQVQGSYLLKRESI